MHLTLLESDRSLLRSAEWATLSILAHAGLVWLAVGLTDGGRRMPADEREARVFFLLPPDRVVGPVRQTEVIRWGKLGGELAGGTALTGAADGRQVGEAANATRHWGPRSGARGTLPYGPTPFRPDTAFSVLEVDQMVERFEGSAAPVYPEELIASGREGQVQATYVVDATGRVDTTTIEVLQSDDPKFTESVRIALGGMRFRPAKRAGQAVRQLVQQRFRFRITLPSQPIQRAS